jgi:hypothetical protein
MWDRDITFLVLMICSGKKAKTKFHFFAPPFSLINKMQKSLNLVSQQIVVKAGKCLDIE